VDSSTWEDASDGTEMARAGSARGLSYHGDIGMTDSSSEQDIFDLGRIRDLIELMKQHDLSQLDLRQGDMRIQLRRGQEPVVAGLAFSGPGSAPAGNQSAGAIAGQAATDSEHIAVIHSPMVGTFYAAPNPESPPYVKVGDLVGPETTVCIVEAMKILNHIPAEVSGRIVSVLAENGEPVEYGQRMFEVDIRE
jgi:acetyl-CoA carboxylase biotin carboxyl carrier protein